jgi:excisionase family DNA binding protein
MDERLQAHASPEPSVDATAPASLPACLSYAELSAQTGFSLSTLRRRVREGKLPFIQPGGPRSRIAFPADTVARLLNSISESTTSSREPRPAAPPRPRGPRPKWLQQEQGP